MTKRKPKKNKTKKITPKTAVVQTVQNTPLAEKIEKKDLHLENTCKVSVIVPCYNVEEYLDECLQSVINQSLKDIEIICVDDGSTDGTLDKLNSYKGKDKRIKLLSQQNLGAGAARNKGMKYARGEYLYFMDADDLCSKELLKSCVEVAKKNDADIVSFHFETFDKDGNREVRKGYHSEWLSNNLDFFNYADCPQRICSILNPTPWNKVLRRDFVLKNDLKFEEISSTNDITFSAVSAVKAKKIVLLDRVLYQYRINQNTSITAKKSKNLQNVVIAVESVGKQLRKLPYFERIKDSLVRFEADNYIFSLTHYVNDFNTDLAREFYNHIHQRFNSIEYENFGSVSYKKLHDQYLIIRNNDYDSLKRNLTKKIVVSMTTYPARIDFTRTVLNSIFSQSKRPDRVILYLAEDQFPKREKDLPKNLIELIKKSELQVRWCDDLKPHKKYYYAFQDFKDDLVITIDDDLTYHSKMIENLYNSYLKFPYAVSATRAHLMMSDFDGNLLPYKYWIKEIDASLEVPSMDLLCTGGAGALYPVHLFKDDVFDKNTILRDCLFADDLWLKINEIISEIPVVLAEEYAGLSYVAGTQTERLCEQNVNEGQNDVQLQKIISWADSKYGKGFILNSLKNPKIGEKLMNFKFVSDFYNSRISQLDKDKRELNTEVRKLRRLTENHELTARIDIKNIGAENSGVEIVESDVDKTEFKEPAYMVTPTGRGKVIENNKGALNFKVRAINSGSLTFFLRGIDLRGPDGKRIPAKVTYTSLRINGEEQLKAEQTVWHDIPFKFAKNVKDGDTFDVSITWKKAPPESFALAAPVATVTPPAPKTIVVEKPIGDKKLSDEIASLNKKVADLQNQLKLKDGENAKIKKEALENCERILNMVKTCSVPKVAQNKNDDATVQKLKKEITRIKSSHRYRIGSVITFIPGSIRRWFKRGKK